MKAVSGSVLDAIYAAASGMAPWADAMAALNEDLDTSGMQLVVVDPKQGRLIRSEQPSAGVKAELVDAVFEHVREWHRHDPHMLETAKRPIGELMNTSVSFPRAEYAQHLFYREFWHAFDVRALVASKIAEDPDSIAMIAMARQHSLPPFSPDDLQLFADYVAHLVRAYRIWRHLEKDRADAAMGSKLMEASARPMILVDADLKVLRKNSAADLLLEEYADVVYIDQNRLRCRNGAVMAELEAAIRSQPTSAATGDGAEGRRYALRLSGRHNEGRTLLCSLWSMRPELTMGVFGREEHFLMTMTAPADHLSADPLFLGSMFNLTPAEARLAAAMVTGRPLKEIAQSFDLSVETLRSQLKSMFRKTQTDSQGDLIALLHRVATI